jgi:hypothetical protein
MAGPTTRPFVKAFACAGIAFCLAVAALLIFVGQPGPAAGEAIGRLFAAVVIPALITGFFARRSAVIWPLWRIAATFVGIAVIVMAITVVGRNRS